MSTDEIEFDPPDQREANLAAIPSAGREVIEFEYTPDRRDAILAAIPCAGREDEDKLIAELEKSARFAIMLARKPRNPYRKATLKKLQKLKDDYENLHPVVKAELDHQIGRPLPSAISDTITEIFEATGLPKTGRQQNDAAITFVGHCRRIWLEHNGKEPSWRFSAEKVSPFYRFVEAAMPPEVHLPTSKGANALTGTVRLALDRARKKRRWRNLDKTPA